MTNDSIFKHTYLCIPCYTIEFVSSTVTPQFGRITQYMDIYCNGLKQIYYQIGSSSRKNNNNKKFDLCISFDSIKIDERKRDKRVLFRRHSQESNGLIHVCIGFGGTVEPFNRITAVKNILNHHSNVIAGIRLDLAPPYYSQRAEEQEIGFIFWV